LNFYAKGWTRRSHICEPSACRIKIKSCRIKIQLIEFLCENSHILSPPPLGGGLTNMRLRFNCLATGDLWQEVHRSATCFIFYLLFWLSQKYSFHSFHILLRCIGSYRPTNTFLHLHRNFKFTESRLETARQSLHHSCARPHLKDKGFRYLSQYS